jgi:formylglycine-generating enzyme required for sulfatase activity
MGQTMIVLKPKPFHMGTPSPAPLDAEDREKLHTRTIGRKFAIATREVTVKEYTDFLRDIFPDRNRYESELGKIRRLHSPYEDSPLNNVTWIMAARYCDWLSEKDPSVGETNRCYLGAMKLNQPLPAGYLSRTGYRLPTEAEWEYACRADSITLRPYGEDRDLIVKYACVPPNSQGESTFRVGLLMPNDYGIFDMLGNVLEWCGGPYETYGRTDDKEVRSIVSNEERYIMRGGSFYNPVSRVRSAYRSRYAPDIAIENSGFRIARTISESGKAD